MNNSTLTRIVVSLQITCASCTSSELGSPLGSPDPASAGHATGSQGAGASPNSNATGGTGVSSSTSRALGGSQSANLTGSGGSTTTIGGTAADTQQPAGGRSFGGAKSSIGDADRSTGGRQTTGAAGATSGSNAIGGTSGATRRTNAVGAAGGISGGSAIGGGASTSRGTSAAIGAAGNNGTNNGGTSTAGAASVLVGGNSGSAGSSSGPPSPGCGKSPTLASGSLTIQSGGQGRQYMLRIPENYDKNHRYRLVFAFHWNGGTMSDIDGGGTSGYAWSYYGLREQANNSTIFVAPQGIGNGWANSGGRDLTLVDDLVKLIEGDLCVDTTQIFSVGFSYGGGMTYELACARATVFRAVAVYSGAQLSGCDGGKQPVAYLGIHGVSDGTCSISGGRGLRDTFVKNNGCTAQNPPEPGSGSGKHTCTTYQGCKSGYPVEWCAFDGGHTPGNVDGGGDDGAKTWTKAEVWKFFTQFAGD